MVSGIILAGGSSTRYGTGENKTLVELLGRPVLEYSLRVFLAADVVDEVVLAAKAGEEAALRKLAEGLCLQKPVTVVTGGADRAASVEKALAAARGEVVLIQDGARPLVTERMLEDCLAALEEADGATIATPSRDTVKLADEEGYAEATTDRSRTWLIQTPQAFYREELLAAYGPSDRLLRRGALFLVLSCAFGGVLVLVSLARGSSAGAGGLLGPSLGMRGILIAAALSYGALSLVLGRQFAKTQAEGGLCPLTLTKGEKTLRLLALIDTGNTLRDPLTGEGVVVLDCGRAGALVPELAGVPAQAFQRPVELLARFAGEEPDLRLLPYQAVGVPCGLLLAVRVDEAAWGGQRRPRCLCALSPTPLSDGGGYHALVGGEHP